MKNQLRAVEDGGINTDADVGSMLTALQSYGKPHLFLGRSGWNASVGMHVSSKGASFDIKSEYDHKTPGEACVELVKRVEATLADLSK